MRPQWTPVPLWRRRRRDRRLSEARPSEDDDDQLCLHTQYYKKYGIGRQIATYPSLQSCPKKFRGPLAAAFCHDVDIENCHYSIMMQLAQRHNLQSGLESDSLDVIEYYVNNTSECRSGVKDKYDCSEEAAKQLFLSVLNGGGPEYWMHQHGIKEDLQVAIRRGDDEHFGMIQQLQDAYSGIQRLMFDIYPEETASLQDKIFRANPTWSQPKLRRSTFSTLLQNEEDKCLMAMVRALRELDYTITTLVFDGCMPLRKEPGTTRLLPGVMDACKRAIEEDTGYDLCVWEKCLFCGKKLQQCVCRQSAE